MSGGGDVLHYTAGCEGWLEPRRHAALARIVAETHASGRGQVHRIVAGQRASIVRLHGGALAYLITIQPVAQPEPFADLTPRQREIATIAISGATANEIGRATGLSPATVRVHLRDIYSRLEIGTRVELANLAHSARQTRRRRTSAEG